MRYVFSVFILLIQWPDSRAWRDERKKKKKKEKYDRYTGHTNERAKEAIKNNNMTSLLMLMRVLDALLKAGASALGRATIDALIASIDGIHHFKAIGGATDDIRRRVTEFASRASSLLTVSTDRIVIV